MNTTVSARPASDINPQRWLSLAALCVLTGLVWLTATDISIALPTIGQALGGSMDSLQWAVNGYFLAGSLIVLGGRLSDMKGRRKIFIIGGFLLILGSVVSGSAGSTSQLVIGRVIEGVGAAAILPSSLAIVAVQFPENERARAIAIWIAVAWGCQGIGPLIGGGLIQAFGWQAIFWINVPLGIAAIWLVLKTTPETFNTREGAKLDIPGAAVLTSALILLSYGLVECDSASLPTVFLYFGGSALLFALFVFVESRASEPLVPLSVFRRPAFMGAVSANLLANIVFSAVIFIMALYLQVVMGYGALKAGALLLGDPRGASRQCSRRASNPAPDLPTPNRAGDGHSWRWLPLPHRPRWKLRLAAAWLHLGRGWDRSADHTCRRACRWLVGRGRGRRLWGL
ncbi:MAG: MFS transporter [Solirubrobacterales bacterium]|nr:MFS transporter [Solirubrobacterales bacterium]